MIQNAKLRNKLAELRVLLILQAERAILFSRKVERISPPAAMGRGMQIQTIEVFAIAVPHHYKVGGHSDSPNQLAGTNYYIEPQWLHVYSTQTESCLVKMTADDGTVGWGEAQSPITPQTTATLISTLLGPAVLGQNPLDTPGLYERLYYLMLARGHTGSFTMDAIAALDTAAWDLKGQRENRPIAQLLGGANRSQLPAYVSGLRVSGLSEKAQLARKICDGGYAGAKIFIGASIAEVETEVRSIREAIPADGFFAVDAICKYDLANAKQLGKILDDVNAAWFEAPLDAEDIEGHAALAQKMKTPIAVGETLRTVRQFEPWLKSHALGIAQPDVMRTGVTATMRIAARAAEQGVPTTLHVGVCTGIGMAATWQVAAALPDNGLPQEHQFALFEVANRFLKTPLESRAGTLIVPQRAGIGVEVDEATVRSFATEHWVVDRTGRRLVKETQA